MRELGYQCITGRERDHNSPIGTSAAPCVFLLQKMEQIQKMEQKGTDHVD